MAERSLLLFLHLNVKVIPLALEDARGSPPRLYLNMFCWCLACLLMHFFTRCSCRSFKADACSLRSPSHPPAVSSEAAWPDASSTADILHTWLLAGMQGKQYLWCQTHPLCFRGQVLPAASLLNIVNVELIYEGMKYVLQVRAGPCSPKVAMALLTGTGTCAPVLKAKDAINTRLSFKNVQHKNEVNNLILTRQTFSYILLPQV